MNNHESKTSVTLNDRGIVLLIIIILSMVFTLGYMYCSNGKKSEETIFTWEDLERINRFKEMEEKKGSEEQDIYVIKDSDGKLMIGWKD